MQINASHVAVLFFSPLLVLEREHGVARFERTTAAPLSETWVLTGGFQLVR
jgi:hypothetical protein